MNELKQKVLGVLSKMNNTWINAVREGETSGGIDLSEIIMTQQDCFIEIDKIFYESTNESKKNKGWFK